MALVQLFVILYGLTLESLLFQYIHANNESLTECATVKMPFTPIVFDTIRIYVELR